MSGLFFRLLPYQVLLIVISAVNGIVDGLYASNAIGKTAMSAIGLYGPFNHFFYAASILLVGGSQILYGKYIVRGRERVHTLFSSDMIISAVLSVLTAALLALGAVTGATRLIVSDQADLEMLNRYILGQAIGIPALVLGQQLFAFLSLENQTKRTMAASVACFAVNAVLNHLFVVIIPWGTFGLGLSSSIATWLFFGMPLSVISLHFGCYAQSIERKKLATVLPIIDGMVGVVVFSFLLIPTMKMNGLYISNILNGVLCLAVILVSAWISLKRFPRSLEDLMAIPEGFGVGEDERIDISIREMDQVLNVSKRVIDFCNARGIDARRAFFAGLCLEEMAGNVVTHGFPKDKKENSVDIRVAHSGDEIILRLRDNCVAFNPSERAKSMEPGDAGKNIGIRLVYRIASDVNYQNLLGLNVLTIRI